LSRLRLFRLAAIAAATAWIMAIAAAQPGLAQLVVSVDESEGKHAGEFIVPINKSQILRVDQPFTDLLVGNPDIADVLALTDQTIYVLGKELGSTSLTIYAAGKKLMAIVDLAVTYDIEGLKAKLFELVPGERIEVRPAGNSVVLSGNVSSSENLSSAMAIAERFAPGAVTNLLKVRGSQQVLLEVRFAEVARTVAKKLGLDSTFIFSSSSDFTFSTVTDGALAAEDIFQSLDLIGATGNWTLSALFDFLETRGVVKTLAEPNLVVLSGETASFLAGGEFPVPVPQAGGVGAAITIEFKEFGVGLSFTPTVLGDGLINLVVTPEVSSLDFTAQVEIEQVQVPGLTTRRASTTVELRDGQSLAIAGLLQNDFKDNIKQFPWIGDIPILGALFRSTDYLSEQTELVIVVTPRLVTPVMAGTIATPVDTFVPPSDVDLFLFGRLEDPSSGRGPAGAGAGYILGARSGGLTGQYGHIIK
jgi:pilus assembly protein CpaC